jgi:uncharacterized membrane-anchored protein YhcB (DUF1043 family)
VINSLIGLAIGYSIGMLIGKILKSKQQEQ